MSDPLPQPGWYVAPHANNELRYWDGTQWLDTPPSPTETASAQPASDAVRPASSSRTKAWVIGGSIAAGVLVIGGVGGALGIANMPTAEPKVTVTPWSEPLPSEATSTLVDVPDVVGMTAADAIDALIAAGLEPPAISAFDDPAALVLSTTPAAGVRVDKGRTVDITVEVKPKFTMAQENAIATAQDYLEFSGFSRTGLIGQLEYEGYSTEDATFGVDNAGADWNAEAAETAQDYLDFSSFSRDGLYDQLEYEGFTPEQIEYALGQVGY